VVAVDTAPARLEAARRFGATGAVDARDADAIERLRRAAPREGFDWAIVTVGAADAIRLGVDATRPGRTTAVVGLMPEGAPVPIDMLDVVNYEKRVVGSAYGSLDPRLLVPRIIALYRAGRLELDALVSDRLPLAGVNEAFARSRRGDGLRPVLALADGEAAW
jgi:S-(hydroxymethyl)glutathione dehydrogenase/alcohol dehydrogenase